MFPGKLLEQIRQEKKMTRDRLAKAAGTYESTISRYELDQTANPTWEILCGICKALDVSPDVFYREVYKKEDSGATEEEPEQGAADDLAMAKSDCQRIISLQETQVTIMREILKTLQHETRGI